MWIPKETAGVTYQVKRMTVQEIYDRFEQAANNPKEEPISEPKPRDMVGEYLFDEATLSDILTFTNLTTDQIKRMYPVDVENIIGEIKKENPHFFAACQRMEKACEKLDMLLTGIFSNKSKKPFLP